MVKKINYKNSALVFSFVFFNSASAKIKIYSDKEITKMSGEDFKSWEVPLGNYKYVTDGPKKGYVYLCNARKDNFGAQNEGPWINKTNDLDECHGIISQIKLDGKYVNSYHYVMTKDFPYSVSCFKGKGDQLQVIAKSKWFNFR